MRRLLAPWMLLLMLVLAGCGGGGGGTAAGSSGTAPAAPSRAETPSETPTPAETPAGEEILGRGYPSISVTPSTVAPGGTVSITITGGYSYAYVQLRINGPTGTYQSLSLATDGSGTARTTWTATTPTGYWRFTPECYGMVGYSTYVNVTSTPTPGPSGTFQVTASPTTVQSGQTVTLSVSGATAYGTLWMKFRDPYGAVLTNSTERTSSSGTLTYTWTADNPLRSDGGVGTWSIWAEEVATGKKTAEVRVTVTQPTGATTMRLSASSTSVTAGQPVTLSLTGGYAYSYVYLDRTPPGGTTTSTLLYTNASGSASSTWTPTTPLGAWTFKVRDSGGRTSNQVTVNVGGASSSMQLSASSSSVTAGQSVTLSLTGAPAGYVTLKRTAPGSASIYTTSLYVYSGGTASHYWTSTTPTGAWTFVVTDSAGRTSNTVTVNVTSSGTTTGGIRFTATPSTVSAGQPVTIGVTGATPNTYIYLYRSTTGAASSYVGSMSINSSGTGSHTWYVPSNTLVGTWTYVGYDASFRELGRVSFTVTY
ncbi:MAG: hypothetical protein AB1758_13295 [Candidatus Eremiobacterota bacterium]